MRWVGRGLEELRAFPPEARREIGYALWFAQGGTRHPAAKPLAGFGGAGVLEVVEDHAGDAFRAVYTVRFEEAIYVRHAFQKKSTRGIATPGRTIELIRARLKVAEALHRTGGGR